MEDVIIMSSNIIIRFLRWLKRSRLTIIQPIALDSQHLVADPNQLPNEIKQFFQENGIHRYPSPKVKGEDTLSPFRQGTSNVMTIPSCVKNFDDARYNLYWGLPDGKKALIYLEATEVSN